MLDNHWTLDAAFENNGKLLFTSYQFQEAECIKMDIFAYLMIEEIKNNNLDSSKCTNCLKQIKWELRQMFHFLDTNGNGQITSYELFHAMKFFDTPFTVTSTMTNDFILTNDHSGKASVSREEFVNGILLGMTERQLTPNGFNNDSDYLREFREKNALDGNGPR